MSPFVVFLCTDKSGSIQLCLSVIFLRKLRLPFFIAFFAAIFADWFAVLSAVIGERCNDVSYRKAELCSIKKMSWPVKPEWRMLDGKRL